MKNSGVGLSDFPRLPGFAFVLQEHFKEKECSSRPGLGVVEEDATQPDANSGVCHRDPSLIPNKPVSMPGSLRLKSMV